MTFPHSGLSTRQSTKNILETNLPLRILSFSCRDERVTKTTKMYDMSTKRTIQVRAHLFVRKRYMLRVAQVSMQNFSAESPREVKPTAFR